MAEPTEVITATSGAPELEPVEIGECAGCGQPIYSGEGVTIDKARQRWHPDCRSVELRKAPRAAKRAAGAAA